MKTMTLAELDLFIASREDQDKQFEITDNKLYVIWVELDVIRRTKYKLDPNIMWDIMKRDNLFPTKSLEYGYWESSYFEPETGDLIDVLHTDPLTAAKLAYIKLHTGDDVELVE